MTKTDRCEQEFMSVCFRLCMFLRRRIEKMVFVQEYRIEHRFYDVTSKPWLLAADFPNRPPRNLAFDMRRNFEVAVFWEITIYLQESLLYSFLSCKRAYFNKSPYKFIKHFLFLPFFKSLSWRALVEIEILEVKRQLWLFIFHLTLISHIGSTAFGSNSAFELILKLTLLFCCHTP